MRVIEPGHIYELSTLDGDEPQRLIFVNRESGREHPGTQTQEVLRAIIDIIDCLVDRTNHCDSRLRWEGNDRVVKHLTESQRELRLALIGHEQRALERKAEKGTIRAEKIPVAQDGHFVFADEKE